MDIPVVVQHRHVHLSEEDARVLFGDDCLRQSRPIDQRGQFVIERVVSVGGPKGSFHEVCVIGPVRTRTQVELSASDAFGIGVDAPLRCSGDLDRCAAVVLKTDIGEVKASISAITPIRHLHLPPSVAQKFLLSHHDIVSVKIVGREDTLFEHVVVRVHPTFASAFHLTKDEAAARWVQTGDLAIIV